MRLSQIIFSQGQRKKSFKNIISPVATFVSYFLVQKLSIHKLERGSRFFAVPPAAGGIGDAVGSLLMQRISIAPGLAGPTLKKGGRERQ